ncbi:hypothetical protein AB3M83_08410 [Microbacterium sp. 179-B 1A2 NHS]|uniref:hypothetical protein n=1 Tax=Microbacterium sp. 179-B 1A2 NHS TaxID=3142383 RepID=UPI00399F33E2
MAPQLVFPDPRAAADVLTFAGRAARLSDPVIRLRATGGTMAVSAAPLSPRGFGDDVPTVLGMRFVSSDPELECDLVVDAGALSAGDGGALRLPDSGVSAAWAGISPPRGGWLRTAELSSDALTASVRRGVAAVAAALPADPGEDIVRTVRAAIWGQPDPSLGGVAAGASFAADALGFLAADAESVGVYRTGTWTRLTLRRGHVLVRAGNPTGLTAVRSTGGR